MEFLPAVLPGLRLQARPEVHQRIIQYAVLLLSILINATGGIVAAMYPKDPEPYHTSALTGEAWVIELITGHPERIRTELGVHAHVFAQLISELRVMGHTDSRFVSLEEQLAIFLYTVVTGLTIRHVGERFQRSNETISRYFRRMLSILSTAPFYKAYVRLPDDTLVLPPKIRNNGKFWPFFKDAIGAIDGSHIHAFTPAFERAAYRDRKGQISQNCLFACDFDMRFTYALTGWEGSATDARIYEDACAHDLRIPAGKYFLADAGFPARSGLLIPYRGVRYHLAEWGRANVRPCNKEELFNLRHSSARNVIERIFGVLKRRFRILLLSPAYSLEVQAQIPAALCALHNFIRHHDADEGPLPDAEVLLDDTDTDDAGVVVEQDYGDANDMIHLRDNIAQAMWVSYQQLLEDREEIAMFEGLEDLDLSDHDDDDDVDVDDDGDEDFDSDE